MLAGEDETALGTAPGERDIGPDEPGGAEPPPEPPAPEFLADAGTADIGMPDEDAADELVGDDMDAAEWAALDARAARRRSPRCPPTRRARRRRASRPTAPTRPSGRTSRRASRTWRPTQQQIVTAAREHEAARVRRKVVASTTGAGAAGFIPLLLQLVDALSLSPQVAATVTSAVAALGALVAGYLTPERAPVLPPAPESVDASPLDVAPHRAAAGAGAAVARRAGGPPRSTGRQVTPDGRARGGAWPLKLCRSVKDCSGGARDGRFSIGDSAVGGPTADRGRSGRGGHDDERAVAGGQRVELERARRRRRSTRARALREGVDGLEEVDALGAVVHRHDDAGAEPGGDLGRLLGADRRAAADGDEEEVDGAQRLRLLVAQRALAEVAEVRHAPAAEREGEQRVGAALGAGGVVVLGGDGEHLADRRLQAPGGRAQRHRVAGDRADAVVVEVLVGDEQRGRPRTPSIAG